MPFTAPAHLHLLLAAALGLSLPSGAAWANPAAPATAGTAQQAVAGGPSSPAARALLEVQTLMARGEAAGALLRIEAALAAQPDDGQWQFLQAVAWLELGRDAEAMAGFERLHQRFPELPEPLNNIALLQAKAGRLEEARATLESALRSDPSHRLARLNLGEVHLLLAVRHWEHAAAAMPLEPRLQQRLAAARALAGNGLPAAR